VEEEEKLELTGWITQTKLFILCQAFVGASWEFVLGGIIFFI
jgi:hypothetical protein